MTFETEVSIQERRICKESRQFLVSLTRIIPDVSRAWQSARTGLGD